MEATASRPAVQGAARRRAAAHRRRAQTSFHRQERRAEAHVALRRRQVSTMTNYLVSLTLRGVARRCSPATAAPPPQCATARRDRPAASPRYVQAPRAAASRSRSCRKAPPARAPSSSSPPSSRYDEKSLPRAASRSRCRSPRSTPRTRIATRCSPAPISSTRRNFRPRNTSPISFAKRADGGLEAVGKLTLRGVTRDLRLPLKIIRTATGLELSGETAIKRLDYGVGQGEWKSTESVGDEVKLQYKVSLIKAK